MGTEQFPQRLSRLRRRKGWSQEVLAGLSGLSERTIRKYEHGTLMPSMQSLSALADALDTSMDYLSCREVNS